MVVFVAFVIQSIEDISDPIAVFSSEDLAEEWRRNYADDIAKKNRSGVPTWNELEVDLGS